MKFYVAALAVIFSPLAVMAQAPTPSAQKLPVDVQNQVLKLQKQRVQIQDEEKLLQLEFQSDVGQLKSLDDQIKTLEDGGVKQLSLDPAKVDVNQDTFDVTPKPEPKKDAAEKK